ncbi:MAG: HAD-IIIC family phosphatase [Candidatus Thiodiazotropha sp.]
MFELELSHSKLDANILPNDILNQFHGNTQTLLGYAILPWEEHCTECAMPECYQTCDLYEAREDGKCRRFIGGFTPIRGSSNRVVRIAFKRWGQLLAYANLNMIPTSSASRIEKLLSSLDVIISKIPDQKLTIKGRSAISSRMERRLKQSVSRKGYFKDASAGLPDQLMLEIYNPNQNTTKLSLVIINTDRSVYNMGYQDLLEVKPGFNHIGIDFAEIAPRLDLNKKFSISLTPNILDKADEGLTLYFGMLTFTWLNKSHQPSTENKLPTIKVVAWDLDNTLWDGILIEDGPDKLETKPGIVEIITQLDKRGILNTVVSKNNYDEAIRHIERIGLKDYLIYPKIGWGQKGLYIQELINEFNVGADTFAFIDDSPFERDEVKALNPKVRVYDAVIYNQILSLPEFTPKVSTESHLRRQQYLYEKTRQNALSTFDGDYLSFLASCKISINISPASIERIERIQELVQRTNQLNFSGNRYQREQIQEIIVDPKKHSFVIDCNDKYGEYGTIGFAIVEHDRPLLIDLMFSCRVQSKRVEHAFISFLLNYYKELGHTHLSALYNQNERNKKAAAVFSDMGFEISETKDNQITYRFDLSCPIPDDEVIAVSWSGE